MLQCTLLSNPPISTPAAFYIGKHANTALNEGSPEQAVPATRFQAKRADYPVVRQRFVGISFPQTVRCRALTLLVDRHLSQRKKRTSALGGWRQR
jgi:hypothetical protein